MKKAHYAAASFAPAVGAVLALMMPGESAAQISGDPAKGEAVFVRQCALCHTIGKGAPNRYGPNLFGITERKAASAPGYKYSPAFITMAIWTWSPESVASFIASPGKTIPGNRMAVFPGVAERDLDNIIAYLAKEK
jgi:cytochrome c